MTLPKEALEMSIWINLDKHKELELILLKGHLLLEVIINDVINRHLSENQNIESLRLTYNNKVKLLYMLAKDNNLHSEDIKRMLLKVNSIRNKLAHNFQFNEQESDFEIWAIEILKKFPVNKISKYTYRTKIVHAFATISREIYDYK